MPKLGLDVQKSDTMPSTRGNAAMDADARKSLGRVGGRSGGARVKDSGLNLGGLSFCEDDLRYSLGNVWRRDGRSQPRS